MSTRIIVSGPGLIGKQHVRLVQARHDCQLVAIVAPATEENAAFARGVGVPLYDDLRIATRHVIVDGVVISSPNHFHKEQATICLQQGLPVLVEKPITDTVEDAEHLVRLVEQTGVPLLVGHHRTYSPLVSVVLDILRCEKFGKMVAITGSALFMKPDHYFEDGPWRKVKGGGPILINLIHEVGLMRLFAGEICSVQAIASHQRRGFEVEDTVAINFEFEGGALGTFLLSDAAASNKSWEMTAGENPAYPFFPDDACYHMAGTNGSIDFPSMSFKCYSSPDDRSWWKSFQLDRVAVERADPLERQIEHFVDVIARRATPLVSAFDGYQNLRVLQAIIDAIKTGARTLVPH
ncbi:Gfo/Idh/MocA family protein [Agrobacterium cavarae]|uniref:Gfo/Idh/MocA family protein n=1 Tax=Agrobacterium cavarae TaxID=2528239 RepID=UPI003FD45669